MTKSLNQNPNRGAKIAKNLFGRVCPDNKAIAIKGVKLYG